MRSAIAAFFLVCTAFPAPAAAQTFSPDRIRGDVAFLSDDLLEGRATGSVGYDIAARYVATRFEAIGLKPGGTNGWYQTIPFVSSVADPARPSALTLNGVRFLNGDHVAISPTVTAATIDESASAVFVGYGLENKQYGLDDYRGLDVRGKIIVYIWGTPEGLPSEIAATLNDKKAEVATNKGAIGAIAIASPALLSIFPWDKILENNALSRMRWVHPDGQIQDPAGALRLSGMIDPIAAQKLFEGTPLAGKLPALLADRKARPKGFNLRSPVRVERYSVIERTSSPNVVGLLEGSDASLASEMVMISAHLDHIGILPGEGEDRIANGALDNAAGIATMLEAARAFESAKRPRRTIAFVALTGEEKGLYGSEYLAKYPLPGRKLVANVNLDMPILLYDFSDVIAFGAEHSNIGEAVRRAAGQMGIRLSPDPEPEQNSFVRSDHYSFVKEGVPAVSLETGWANGGQTAAKAFLDSRYHAVSDDMTQAINWSSAAKFAKLNYLIASDLANAVDSPRWYSGDFFGDKFAAGQPKTSRANAAP